MPNRLSNLATDPKLAKLLDFIDLMKIVDFNQGGSNANEYQKMKKTKAEETQKFYEMFWILKNFGFWKILDIAEKSSIRVPF